MQLAELLTRLKVLGGQIPHTVSLVLVHAAVLLKPAWQTEHEVHAVAFTADHDVPDTHEEQTRFWRGEQVVDSYWPALQPSVQAAQGA